MTPKEAVEALHAAVASWNKGNGDWAKASMQVQTNAYMSCMRLKHEKNMYMCLHGVSMFDGRFGHTFGF